MRHERTSVGRRMGSNRPRRARVHCSCDPIVHAGGAYTNRPNPQAAQGISAPKRGVRCAAGRTVVAGISGSAPEARTQVGMQARTGVGCKWDANA